jgi:hypothetical protein
VSQIPSKDDLNNVWSEANHTSDKTKDTVIEKPIGKAKFKSKKEVRIRYNFLIILFCYSDLRVSN